MRRLLLFTLFVAVAGIVISGFVDDLPATLIVLPLVLAGLTIAAVWSAVLLVKSLRKRTWSSVAVLAVLPALAMATAVHPAFLRLYFYPVDTLHFFRELPAYDRQVATLPHDGKRYREFDWGGWTFLSHGVVYDETDEVALPYGRQSAAWKRRMKNTDLTCGGDGPFGYERHLWGHYYLTDFGC